MSKRIAVINLEKDRCWLCPFFQDTKDRGLCVPNGFCLRTNRPVYNCDYIPDWCPLIPASGYIDEHGNLISWSDEGVAYVITDENGRTKKVWEDEE